MLASGNVDLHRPEGQGAREARERRSRSASASRSTWSCARWTSCTRSSTTSPFGDEVDNATRYFVVFLAASAGRSALARQEQDFAPDRFAAGGREIYAWCPEGMQNSRLMKALGKPGLAATATVRNMATVKKLLE